MSQPKKSNRPVDVDERNMPKHGPASQQGGSDLPPDADMEERFTNFFRRNGASLLGSIALAAVIVVGTMVYRYMGEQNEQETREAFRAAQGDEAALTSFTQAYEDHPLSALAFFQIANLQYEEGDYRQALEHFQMAAEGISQPPFAERARLGMAMSQLRLGESETAAQMLREIAQTSNYLGATRGEAAYHLAVHYWQNEDAENMQSAIDLLNSIDTPGMWSARGERLIERLEKLRAEQSATASAE